MTLYSIVNIAKNKACKHLGLPNETGLHFTVINAGILFYRDNLLYAWNGELQELTRDNVKELAQGLQLGEF